MKSILLIIVLSFNIVALAQTTEAYYDFYWKPTSQENAVYYSTIQKVDSGWLRNDYYARTGKLQMQALYEDKACKVENGHTYYFHANGLPSIIGKKIHGLQEGICISYHRNGMMADSALFDKGKIVEKRFRWHPNGYIADSISRINDSTISQVGWFDDGAPAYAGILVNGKNKGKWKYFHHNGQVSASEFYSNGKRINVEYFDETGQQITDTSLVGREANMKGGTTAWIKYLEKKLYWPSGLKFATPASVTVGVSFVVDENGKITNVEVNMPFHEEFDKIAVSIIKNSPDWLPGIAYNRKVKAYRIQPVTFVQPD